VYQAHQRGKWNPRSSAYGRFWIEVRGGERKRRTIALGLCATQWTARLRLREYIERAGVHSKHRFQQIPVPGTTFRQQAEWWMESLSTRRRRPLKPATIYGWQHCLDRWILPNLANKLVSEVGNGALRQFVEILTAARLAPKTIVNVITVVKFVVASAVDEEGDDASKHRKLRTRFDSLISRRHWHKFYVDIRKERKAISSRRELDGFLTSATPSKRCTGQGIEVDSTLFGAFALRYFARQACRRT